MMRMLVGNICLKCVGLPGYVCPKCKIEAKHWITAQNLIHCSACGHQNSLMAGTLFHGTRKPLLGQTHEISFNTLNIMQTAG